jgi:aminoglycoside phosphotransferase family enzyme
MMVHLIKNMNAQQKLHKENNSSIMKHDALFSINEKGSITRHDMSSLSRQIQDIHNKAHDTKSVSHQGFGGTKTRARINHQVC